MKTWHQFMKLLTVGLSHIDKCKLPMDRDISCMYQNRLEWKQMYPKNSLFILESCSLPMIFFTNAYTDNITTSTTQVFIIYFDHFNLLVLK